MEKTHSLPREVRPAAREESFDLTQMMTGATSELSKAVRRSHAAISVELDLSRSRHRSSQSGSRRLTLGKRIHLRC
ncbi:hypothetical protein AGR7A_pAt30132 [Agrobacterium deltaense NCPPB 1641]|uniref:Uncharacterized protein n=1 Tax=Agrobacterium deltaense NCPPB 1641 TaxID=1183425 RepID=A0A1S7UB19_9HYPH|nr:hypothetical protein AGR7A_pAt30132 [Agrobacterium deltaense NCPPB 1641]